MVGCGSCDFSRVASAPGVIATAAARGYSRREQLRQRRARRSHFCRRARAVRRAAAVCGGSHDVSRGPKGRDAGARPVRGASRRSSMCARRWRPRATPLPSERIARGNRTKCWRRRHTADAAACTMGGQDHFYLEGQIALALPQEGGGMLVHSSTQHPTEVQGIVAHALGIPRARGERAVSPYGRRLRRQGESGRTDRRRGASSRAKPAVRPSCDWIGMRT